MVTDKKRKFNKTRPSNKILIINYKKCMKALKIMSIIGFVVAGLTLVFAIAFDNVVDYEAGIGWGMIGAIYLIAFAVVALVQANKQLK